MQVSIKGGDPIPGHQPFICSVVPAKLYSAFTASNISAIAGKEFKAVFLGKDRFQNAVNSFHDVILATLIYDDDAVSPIKSFALVSGDGLYKAAFQLTKSGLYSIAVQINDDTPQKNPYFLTCTPEQVSNPVSSGLSMIRIGNTTQLLGQDSTAGTTGVWVFKPDMSYLSI